MFLKLHMSVRRRACLLVCAAALPFAVPLRATAQTPALAAPGAVSVTVASFRIEGNTLLPAPDIEQRLAPFKGSATMQKLQDAAATVQEMYRAAGYGGVVAYLPEQDLAAGTVRIRVVEGRLNTIELAAGKQFSGNNLLASVPSLKVGRTPLVRRIDTEIQMANENPAKALQVLLQPGSDPGSISAKLSVNEQPVQRITARTDNTGSRQNGRWRAALGWQHANLFDADHVAAVEWQTAPQDARGLNVISGSYRAPMYAQHMALDAYGAWSDVDAGKVGTQAGDLSFAGRGTILGARASWYLPRIESLDQRVLLGAEWREYRNTCAINGLPQNSCGAAGASVSLLPLSLTYTAQAAAEIRYGFSAGVYVNAGARGDGTSAADFDAVRSGAKSRYALLRANAQLAVPVEGIGVFSARGSAQFAAKALVPGEMFGIGGSGSVRGFEERELSGDSGLSLTLEATGPSYAEKFAWLKGGDLRGLLFADAGWVANKGGYACQLGRTSCSLASLGAGLRMSWRELTARVDVGVALNDAATTRQGGVRAHASLAYNY